MNNKMKMRFITYAIGCLFFSIGAKFFINSKAGVDPLDTLVIGLSTKLHCKIGTAAAMVAIFFLVVWSVWNKRKPIITPFVTMTLVGYLIDLWNYLFETPEIISMVNSYCLMVAGLLICAYASSLIIMSGIGIRTMDLVAITIVNKLKSPFFVAKGIIEFMFIATGILLGGPFGVGTFAFLLMVGPLIQPCVFLNKKIFSLVNYGMGESAALV